MKASLRRRLLRNELVRRGRDVRELRRLISEVASIIDAGTYSAQAGQQFKTAGAAARHWVYHGSRSGLLVGVVPRVTGIGRPQGISATADWARGLRATGFPARGVDSFTLPIGRPGDPLLLIVIPEEWTLARPALELAEGLIGWQVRVIMADSNPEMSSTFPRQSIIHESTELPPASVGVALARPVDLDAQALAELRDAATTSGLASPVLTRGGVVFTAGLVGGRARYRGRNPADAFDDALPPDGVMAAAFAIAPAPAALAGLAVRAGTDPLGGGIALVERFGPPIVVGVAEILGPVPEIEPGRQVAVATAPLSVNEGVPRLRWAIASPHPADPSRRTWGDYHFAEALARSLRDLGQTVVIDPYEAWGRPDSHLDDVLVVLRGIHQRRRPDARLASVLWVISHPELVSKSELADFDLVFAASRPWADNQRLRRPILPLLQCTDPGRFHPGVAAPTGEPPLLFVGNRRGSQRRLIEDVAVNGLGLQVYGRGWANRLPEGVWRGEHISNEQLPAAYRRAGVVLNDHWPEMATAGFLSNRLFDLSAVGAAWISDPAADLVEVFGPVARVARTADDVATILARHDLPDEQTRARFAEVTARQHSFAARAGTLLDEVLRTRREG